MAQLGTTLVPVDQQIYHAVATVHDPRTDDGMQEEPPHEAENQGRVRAIQLAQQWAKEGYWGSVYNQVTGECIDEYPPKGHHKDKAASKQ